MSAELQRGIGVSAGISIGRALVLETHEVSIYRLPILPRDVDRELERWQQAVGEAKRQLQQLHHRIEDELGENYSAIFDAHLLMLEDHGMIDSVSKSIREQRVNAEWALKENVDGHLQVFEQINDRYIQERGGDLEDVHRRLQRILAGSLVHHDLSELTEDVIVVAEGLSPSDTALLNKEHVIGMAVDEGSRTSHTAIIARALEIPAVLGLGTISQKARTGDLIVVDGDRGQVLINPDPPQIDEYQRRRGEWEAREKELQKLRDLPAITEDKVEVKLLANIELPDEVEPAVKRGASGIGLYRSEFLYLQRSPAFPSEEEHYLAYRHLAEKVHPRFAVIRTLDLGGEKYFHSVLDREEINPVMGMRAIRLCFRRPDIFRSQLRGILRASAHGSIRMMFPMVTGIGEVRQARSLFEEAREELRKEGQPFDENMKVGIMIEVPAAAAVADLLAAEVDFFSIGTNDLIQYTLAIDRGNQSVSYLYEPLHPSILRQIKFVADAARHHGIPVSVCGEMAGDPRAALLLVGLGYRVLSVSPFRLAMARWLVRQFDQTVAESIAAEVLEMATTREVIDRLTDGIAGLVDVDLLPDGLVARR